MSDIGTDIDATVEYILQDIRQNRLKAMMNQISVMMCGNPQYPEITEEARAEEVERERATYMYGYGMSFQDDRELRDFERGRMKS